MRIPKQVLDLIAVEQARQSGCFVPEGNLYIEKLDSHAELLTHQDPSGVLGFVFFYCNAQDKMTSYVTLICTSIEARGRGVGYALLKQVLSISRQRGFSFCQLEVGKSNIQALKFYQRFGFASIEDRGEKYLMSVQLR